MKEEPGLLRGKPLAQVFVPAVGESANEVTDVVILLGCLDLDKVSLGEGLGDSIVLAFDVKAVLLAVLVDLLGHHIVESLFVLVVEELDLLEDLETGDSNMLKLMDPNCLLRWFIVEADLL